MSRNVYVVDLDSSHPGYQSVTLCSPSGYDKYVVVMVDVEKLIFYSNQDLPCYVVKPVSEWDKTKRDGIYEFLAPLGPNDCCVRMPIVHFYEEAFELKRPFWKIFGARSVQVLRWISYTNGRHRTRYLHFAGAKRMPVLCRDNEAAEISRYCG